MNNAYEKYLQSPHWKAIRAARISIDHGECQLCGAKSDLCVHHKSYSDMDDINNLVTLCKKCHADIHKFAKIVIQSSENGKLKACMDEYDKVMAEIVDSFVIRREKTLNLQGDAIFMTCGKHERMNKYIKALFTWHPYGELIGYRHKRNCGISFTRYNIMRLAKKRKTRKNAKQQGVSSRNEDLSRPSGLWG